MLHTKRSVVVNAPVDTVFSYVTTTPPGQLVTMGEGRAEVIDVVINEQIIIIFTAEGNPLGQISDRYLIQMEPCEGGTLIKIDADIVENFFGWIVVVVAFPFALLRQFVWAPWAVRHILKRIKSQVETVL